MNQLQISVINVTIETVPTAKGSYQKAEVTYKNRSYQDKVEAKKIMSFAEKEAFAALKDAQFGQEFYISREKDDKGYWKWVNVSTEPKQQGQENMAAPIGNPAPKSNYETAEERAKRQVMIVRQSSISSAVQALKLDKNQLNAQEVINMARIFESYVLGEEPDFDDVPL